MVPLLGLSWPVTSFMNVDLPAPFGPRRPVIPGGTVTVTSFSPDTWPYHFDRCSVLITGCPPVGESIRLRPRLRVFAARESAWPRQRSQGPPGLRHTAAPPT